jgi:hypothetical protein
VSEYQTWAPTKPAEEYEDDEIRGTPLFDRIRSNISVPGPGGQTIQLPDATVITLARDAIKEMWGTLQVTRFSATILEVFRVLDENDIDHNDEVIIRRSEDSVGSYKLMKAGGRKRFSHDNYAHFIGRGTPKDSELYREAVTALREKCGLDESVLEGGFLLVKKQMRSDHKNGVFELVLEKGIEGNGSTDKFRARLKQFPFTKQKVPTIVFPPQSGEKGKDATLIVTDEIQEVASMSQMLKSAIVKGAQTPAVVFDLVDLLKKEQRSGSDDGSSDEQPAAEEQEPERPKSAAHSLLDDDDDD